MNFKQKVESCSKICGTHVNVSDPIISEIFGSLGYDFVWIDMEHTSLSCEQVHNHILAARSAGTPAIVRVPVHDLSNTKRILEMGPDGIIFPMVHNLEEAKELLSWCIYPPCGERGCDPKVLFAMDLIANPITMLMDTKSFADLFRLKQNPYWMI